jgi:hypothetical protein
LSWTVGMESGTEQTPRLGNLKVFRYRRDEFGTIIAHGLRDRQSIHGHWHYRRYRTMFEYVRSAQRVASSQAGVLGRQAYLAHHAWQGVFSVNFNGDENTFFGVNPSRPFDLRKRQWGSASASIRYQELYVDRAAFPHYGDPERWARMLRGLSASLQWHINVRFEAQLDVDYSIPSGTAANLPQELMVMTRLEMSY